MSNTSISYSSANRFKACPTKYYLSKKYSSRSIPSALTFGKAIEEGITSLLLGGSLQDSLALFEQNWLTENYGDGKEDSAHPRKAIQNKLFDNINVEYYASDFDKNIIAEKDDALFQQWAKELLNHEGDWTELWEALVAEQKEGDLHPEKRRFYNRVMWQLCYIRGSIMIEAFAKEILPKVEYVVKVDNVPACQKKVSLKNEEGDEIMGYVDYVLKLRDYDKPIIFDLKTAAYRYTMHNLDTSEQLKTYAAALYEDTQSSTAGYIVLIKKIEVTKLCDKCGAEKEGLAKNCKKCGEGKYSVNKLRGAAQIIYKEFDPKELDDILLDYENVIKAVKYEVCFKNPANCTQYNRQCDFYNICWKNAKPEELSHLIPKEEKSE